MTFFEFSEQNLTCTDLEVLHCNQKVEALSLGGRGVWPE